MLIGICGGSATGKSTIAAELVRKLRGSLISSDAYFKPASQIVGFGRYHYDTPEAIDSWALQHDVLNLCQGKSIDMPKYSMVLSKVTGHYVVEPRVDIVLEGLHWIANARLRQLCDVIVLSKADPSAMLLRRVARDSQTRGREFCQIVHNFNNQVLPAYQRYWQPLHHFADICVHNNTGGNLETLLPQIVNYVLARRNNRPLRVA